MLHWVVLGRKARCCTLLPTCHDPAEAWHPPGAAAGNRKVGEFLGKDFSSEEAKASAAKNAFALLGQHRWVAA